MMRSRRNRCRSGAKIVLCTAAALLVAAPASAADDPPVRTDAPAMQGHDAEARMRDPLAEARWRRLFFDAATQEAGEPAVSCDHRAARRPDTIAGPGAVAIRWEPATGRVIARLWASADADPIDLDAVGRAVAALPPAARPGEAIDALAFRRCR